MSPLVFTGGPVLTMDDGRPTAEAVVVEGDRIVAVGSREVARAHPGSAEVDLAGRTLLPGLIDAHNHLCIAALHPRWADLSGVGSNEALEAALRAHAEREGEATWLRGAAWDDSTTGFVPHLRDLDAMGLGRPVIIAHYTLHQGVVDSAALDLLGIGDRTPDPQGGHIGRDRDGARNGLLVERAWSGAHGLSVEAYSDPDRWGDHIVDRAVRLLADGITCVHDAACPPAAERVYGRLARAGKLPVSVLAMPHPGALLGRPDPERLEGPVTGEGTELFRVGPMKLFADGGVEPAVAASLGGRRVEFGTRFAGLSEDAEAAAARGFRIAVHAIGNQGLADTIDACTRIARRHGGFDHRFRVEHVTLAAPAQIRAMASLGMVGVVQPGFLSHLGEAVKGVAFDDATWLPFGDLVRAGVQLAASSDDPCTFYEPLRCARHGASRRTRSGHVLDAGQSVHLVEWLRAYTAGAAYAGGQESERGRLRAGLRADLVVLDGPVRPEGTSEVCQTWVGGRLAYDRSAPSS